MAVVVNKKVRLRLAGLDGNAWSLLWAFSKRARLERWSDAEIKAVVDEAKSGDYTHLLRTITDHCMNGGLR